MEDNVRTLKAKQLLSSRLLTNHKSALWNMNFEKCRRKSIVNNKKGKLPSKLLGN